jgi:threonine synthase
MVRKMVTPNEIANRKPDLWRYHELLPVQDIKNKLCLGEGFTPLIHAQTLGQKLDFPTLYIKDESQNPTGSFKARGLTMAVSRARELGVKALSIPSAGNAAGAMSAYAAMAGIPAYVFMPEDVPHTFIQECQILGAEVTLVEGRINIAGKKSAEFCLEHNCFDVSTLKEPYRLEGKKTMGYEIAELMEWKLPDVIIYPTGGGTGLVGMWKAFDEMEALGWIGSERPRMVAVQSKGCAPIVKAFNGRSKFAESWQEPITIAEGLCVPSAVGDFLILNALYESNGIAIAVSDIDIRSCLSEFSQTTGIFACPEGAATLAAFKELLANGWIRPDEIVTLFQTGSGLKYTHLLSD